jgi:hypothetical protein
MSVGGLWGAIAAAGTRRGRFAASTTDDASGPSDAARKRLQHVTRVLDGRRQLVIDLNEGRTPPMILRILAGELTAADEIALVKLRDGLDRLAGGPRRSIQ